DFRCCQRKVEVRMLHSGIHDQLCRRQQRRHCLRMRVWAGTYSLEIEMWSINACTETCMTSVKGFGSTHVDSTAITSSPRIRNSRPLISGMARTLSLATSPKYTRLTIHNE